MYEQRNKEDAAEKDKKRLDSAKESDRTLVSPSKSDLAESEGQGSCDEYFPVCILLSSNPITSIRLHLRCGVGLEEGEYSSSSSSSSSTCLTWPK